MNDVPEKDLQEELALLRHQLRQANELIAQLTEQRDIALVHEGELREALAHYRNFPPPHPKAQ